MAEGPDPMKELTARLEKSLVFSDNETQITVCTWNIDGKARADLRKEVTTATFEQQQYEDGTSLAQSDIIFIQELTVQATRKDQEYLPFASGYGVVQVREPTRKYNAVYYNKEKFSEVNVGYLTDEVYELMVFKRECCDYIQKGKDDRIEKAIKGELEWGHTRDQKEMCREVLRECREADTVPEFRMRILPRYQAPGEEETKDPFDLLNRRMAICALKVNSLPEQYIIAVSVHNYNPQGRHREATPVHLNYATLLFDFLSKLWNKFNCIIIVAGDFNFDIVACEDRFLTPYLAIYNILSYSLAPLRRNLQTTEKKIDFIMITIPRINARLEIIVKDVQAHNLQVSKKVDDELKRLRNSRGKPLSHSDITNHNPVSATIELKLKNKHISAQKK